MEQPDENGWSKPTSYASRALSTSEQRLAQIKKEALAIIWTCDRLSSYIIGKSITIVTDHKPLVVILGTKMMDQLPPRLQRFRIRMMRYVYKIEHISGKLFYIPDTLSRAPIESYSKEDDFISISEVDEYTRTFFSSYAASDSRIEQITKSQERDLTCKQLMKYITCGWPAKINSVSDTCKPFWGVQGEITCVLGIIMKGSLIYVPIDIRGSILERIHEGHLGIDKCIARAKCSVWWPGISKDIKQYVNNCENCLIDKPNRPEPMISTSLPGLPWEVIAADLAERNGVQYLVLTDYYSRYPEVFNLTSTTAEAVISKCKAAFSRQGIPRELKSDNGPQFKSELFRHFAEEYGFKHVTSSPRYPKSNGLVEVAVKTIKNIIKRSKDPILGLLSYRNTPLSGLKYSPAQLLMGRSLRCTMPIFPGNLLPKPVDIKEFHKLNEKVKFNQRINYDRRHRTMERPTFNAGQKVWITDLKRFGNVESSCEQPRSYNVVSQGRLIRRNKEHLKPMPQPEKQTSEIEGVKNIQESHKVVSKEDLKGKEQERKDNVYVTRSGRKVVPPKRMDL